MILLLDNYDSFVHNLARYVRRLGHETRVIRSDAVDWRGVAALRPSAIILSPGPCTPAEAGCSVDVAKHLSGKIPLLGVCLGHQAIGAATGGAIVRANEPMHGRTSLIYHRGASIFAGLPTPLRVCRYHSLLVDRATLGDEFEVIAWTADDTIMAVAHRDHPTIGVQFHPEAILTEHGYAMLAAFLQLAGLTVPAALPSDEITPIAADMDAGAPEWNAEVTARGYVDTGQWPLPGAATMPVRSGRSSEFEGRP